MLKAFCTSPMPTRSIARRTVSAPTLETPMRSILPSSRSSASAPSWSSRAGSTPARVVALEAAQVDQVHALDAERAEVLLDLRLEVGGLGAGQPGAGVVAGRADLGDEAQALGVGVQRLADQVVDDVGAVELRGVDVVDAELDGAAQHGARRVGVGRRPEDAGTGELHGAEADAVDRLVAEEGGV